MKKKVLLIGGSALALLLLVVCVVSLELQPTPPATPAAQSSQAPTQAPTTSQATPTPQATEKPTVKPVIPRPKPVTPTSGVTHGTPQLGGLFSDFYGKYGTPFIPTGSDGSESWNISEQPSIAINAAPDGNGKAVHISVTEIDLNTGDTWSIPQMIGYCARFLPADASEYNRVSDPGDLWIDYNSSIGQLVELLTTGTCTLSIVQQ